ncbi:MAG: hypothetical protein CMJ89_16365 [Planctomycetes bacterium]|nr:hypothetical protein [Planctomycetota bacterium]
MPEDQEAVAPAVPATEPPAEPVAEAEAGSAEKSTTEPAEKSATEPAEKSATEPAEKSAEGSAKGADAAFKDWTRSASLGTPPADGSRPGARSKKPAKPKKRGRIRGLAFWMEKRAQKAISKVYRTQADDLEERARRVVGSAYREHSDDLEERAIRVLRCAIADEADRIKQAISHGVAVKKVEVRLSLLVLVVASLIYLGLYWLTQGGGGE